MKIPNEIRIAGVDYPVNYVENLNNGINVAYGQIDFEKSEIHLNQTDNLNHQKKCIVLWHEILHCLIHDNGYKFEEEEEEKVVTLLSRGIYQVLQDNGRKFFDIVDK